MPPQSGGARMNARFWIWLNGSWVKLTLQPGEIQRWHKYSRDEEGFSCESYQWTHEGPHVTEFVHSYESEIRALPLRRP